MTFLGNRKASAAQPVVHPVDPLRVWQALASVGQALIEAASAAMGKDFHPVNLSLSPRPPDLLCVTDLVNEFLRAKARAGRSDRYLRQLRVSLKSFAAGRARKSLSDVTSQEIEKWIYGQGWAPKTSRGYLGDVKSLLNFAVRRGYVERNAANAVELPVLNHRSTIAVHTPEQVRLVLETARRANLNACRQLAIRYFSGLRSSEAFALRECDLKLEQNLIEVPAIKSKTRQRRLVTIQPNLAAWLALGGELVPLGHVSLRKIIRLSKCDWPANVTRHSFASYHLAHFQNAGKTALEAGHSEAILFAHYRAVVSPAAAAEYWRIFPAVTCTH
jgi:integrase/recombinase XerD